MNSSMYWYWFWIDITFSTSIFIMFNIFWPNSLSKWYWWPICIIHKYNITNLNFSFLKYEFLPHQETINIVWYLYIMFLNMKTQRSFHCYPLKDNCFWFFKVCFCHKNQNCLFMWRLINVREFYNWSWMILQFIIGCNHIIRTYSMFPFYNNNYIYMRIIYCKDYNIWLWLINKW